MATDSGRTHDRVWHHQLVFDDPEVTYDAVKRLKAEGFQVDDVHSPFPVHGMHELLGMRQSRLPWATLVGGTLGLSLAIFLQVWTHSVDWPLNIGGKSFIAAPAMIPICFELTVLLAAIFTVATLLGRSGLYPSAADERPLKQPVDGVTDDRFVVLVAERDGSFSETAFAQICDELAPKEVIRDRRPA
jgi:hypothetical protein